MSCPLCKQKVPLYKCPKCGLTGHVDLEAKTVTLHMSPIDAKNLKPRMQAAFSVPSHVDCEFAKRIDQIDLDKLEKVKP
jgi:Cu/Ag efflux protein CusF